MPDLFDRPETAILIDTEKRELRRVEWSNPDELDKLCGGPRQEAFSLGAGLMLNLCRVNLVDGGTGFRVSGRPFEGIGVITGGLGANFNDADLESLSHHISFYNVGKSETAYSIKVGREQRAT